MTIPEMKERKKELGYTYTQIAELSGVPLSTVNKVFNGVTTSPRYDTLYALEQVLGVSPNMYIREAETHYVVKQQGDYTLTDYYQIPDDIRVELIDGTFYNMTAPTSPHQLIAGFIHAKLLGHVIANKGLCLPMISPLDVQLDSDEKTMVQPDVIIMCDRDKIINRCIYGAGNWSLIFRKCMSIYGFCMRGMQRLDFCSNIMKGAAKQPSTAILQHLITKGIFTYPNTSLIASRYTTH